MRRRTALPGLVLVAVLLAFTSALATVVVPIGDDDLVDHASAIVVGRVKAIESHWDGVRQQIFTHITLSLHDVLKGDPSSTELTIRQVGGRVGDLRSWVDGSPEFRRGEKVLVFLRPNPDGSLRVAHLYQGKFSVTADELTGEEWAFRQRADGVHTVVAPGAHVGAPAPLEIRHVGELRRRVRERRGIQVTLPIPATAPSVPAPAVSESHEQFAFLGSPSRWFEPDSGQPVTMLMSAAGEPRAPGGGFDAVRAAYRAWSDVAGSTFRYADGGFGDGSGFTFDGINGVSFRDPLGQIDPPSRCTGTLAIGGYFRSAIQTRTVNGQPFFRIVEGDLVIADGWDGCGFYENPAHLAEVLTHELGHVLGLGHSADPAATMYAFAHFDERGASLGTDDIAGLRFVYPALASARLTVATSGPGRGTVTSSPPGIACETRCSKVYLGATTVTLTATPAPGSMFAGWSGGGCSDTGNCTVRMMANTVVTASFVPANLSLAFRNPRRSGAVVRGQATVTMAAAGGGTGYLYTLAVDDVTVYTGENTTFALDTIRLTNGPHTLTGTVTDSLGRRGTASLGVTVSNPVSSVGKLKVTYGAPEPGAVVRGTVWVEIAVEGASGTANTFVVSIDGFVVGRWTISGASHRFRWLTYGHANGRHRLTTRVTDEAGQSGSAYRTVTVRN